MKARIIGVPSVSAKGLPASLPSCILIRYMTLSVYLFHCSFVRLGMSIMLTSASVSSGCSLKYLSSDGASLSSAVKGSNPATASKSSFGPPSRYLCTRLQRESKDSRRAVTTACLRSFTALMLMPSSSMNFLSLAKSSPSCRITLKVSRSSAKSSSYFNAEKK